MSATNSDVILLWSVADEFAAFQVQIKFPDIATDTATNTYSSKLFVLNNRNAKFINLLYLCR